MIFIRWMTPCYIFYHQVNDAMLYVFHQMNHQRYHQIMQCFSITWMMPDYYKTMPCYIIRKFYFIRCYVMSSDAMLYHQMLPCYIIRWCNVISSNDAMNIIRCCNVISSNDAMLYHQIMQCYIIGWCNVILSYDAIIY